MKINFCPNCGSPLSGKEIFCARCGYELLSMKLKIEGKSEESSVPELVDKLLPVVVKIETNCGVGSGFIADTSGIIITNYHVIEGASEIFVKFAEDVRTRIKNILRIDAIHDFAIIEVDPPPSYPLKTSPMGDSDSLRIGEEVIVIGNPLGKFEKTVSKGIISAFRREENLIQMTAPISPGSSGGPVFNIKGEIIGISVLGVMDAQNINFFVPINFIKSCLIPSPVRWERVSFKNLGEEITALAIQPKTDKVFCLLKNKIRIFNIEGKEIEKPIKLKNIALSISFVTPKYLGILYKGGEFLIVDVSIPSPTVVDRYAFPPNTTSLFWDITSNAFLTGDEKGEIVLRREKNILQRNMGSPVRYISSFSFNLYSYSYPVVICEDGTLKILSISIKEPQIEIVRDFEWSGAKITAGVLSYDRMIFVLGTDQGGLYYSIITDVKRTKIKFERIDFFPLQMIISTIFTFDDKYLISGTDKGNLGIYKKKKEGKK